MLIANNCFLIPEKDLKVNEWCALMTAEIVKNSHFRLF